MKIHNRQTKFKLFYGNFQINFNYSIQYNLVNVMKFFDKLNLRQAQKAIGDIKIFFQNKLKNKLNLTRISGPIIINPETGLNDNLTANNKPVSFYVQDLNKNIEIVQSLAKWKRYALKKYKFEIGEGMYVDMNAIRSHEKLDSLHSLYVDQWDWELIIDKKERTIEKLKEIVCKIYKCIYETENYINSMYKSLSKKLPENIVFFSSQELEDKYVNMNFEEITKKITKEYKAVFVMQIGKKLKSGREFDQRSAEYDDWNLNGDLFVWSDILNEAIELSSMGIRVNKESLIKQAKLEINNFSNLNPYYKAIVNDELNSTIGGGIGQSRLCMFFLEKKHIGQVQVSVWDDDYVEKLEEENISLL